MVRKVTSRFGAAMNSPSILGLGLAEFDSGAAKIQGGRIKSTTGGEYKFKGLLFQIPPKMPGHFTVDAPLV